jgi:histidinol-phosphate/aromatic aminotransferase/cobyric acid decarboxylase-like protein
MSKAFGMPGIRIGWLATRDEALMQRLLRLHDYSTICSSAPSEVRAPCRSLHLPPFCACARRGTCARD